VTGAFFLFVTPRTRAATRGEAIVKSVSFSENLLMVSLVALRH
jgi:hypothetical protein